MSSVGSKQILDQSEYLWGSHGSTRKPVEQQKLSIYIR